MATESARLRNVRRHIISLSEVTHLRYVLGQPFRCQQPIVREYPRFRMKMILEKVQWHPTSWSFQA